jgi:uracil-DNA glycosylase
MFENLEESWRMQLKEELKLPFVKDLEKFLEIEGKNRQVVYPPSPLIFQAFQETPFDQVKVVLIGQDPYHGPGQAHGLSFSVPCGIKPPPSLKNIFKELVEDTKNPMPTTGCLRAWAKQGVLLLNATLTVRESAPASHYGKGWESFTDAVVQKLADRKDPVIFVLWGRNAQEKVAKIMERPLSTKHAVLKAAHPSPFSAHSGFFGCRHFSKINYFLEKWGKTPISWKVD